MKAKSLLFAVGLLGVSFGVGAWTAGVASAVSATCVGDCGSDGQVTVDEIITMVNIALGNVNVSTCEAGDTNQDHQITVDEILAAVNNALGGCGQQGNHAPHASDVSLTADPSTPYIDKQLIGSDPDNDTITYELVAADTGTGYSFAYVNPQSGMLYVILTANFQGNIVLPYHVTDGKLFSNTANATIQVQAVTPGNGTGNKGIDPKVYAGFPRGYYNGDLLGAPGAAPTLPPAVDLSKDFPVPGDQGTQSSCTGWATAYALKTYQERVEIGWSLEPTEHKFSPAYIYNQVNGGQDNGASLSDVLDLVVKQGVATLATMPYSDKDFLTQPSAQARQEAAQYPGKSWETANGSIEIKNALANRLPVVWGIWVFDQFEGLKGPDSVYNTFSGSFEGGHATTVVGYDDARYGGAFKIINSWSQNWGDGGYFWMPYSAVNQTVNVPGVGQTTVVQSAFVLHDAPNIIKPSPDPVSPTPPPDLPNLQVTDWTANYDPKPRGAGSLQYTVANTGTGTAPAGVRVALVLSDDATFSAASDIYVIYEQIPFALAPGDTAYRDATNAIPFKFPDQLEAGQYYMAVWVDDRNDVAESNENDNIAPANGPVTIVDTLPDLEVVDWYTVWDAYGTGYLTYDVINNGVSTAPAGWLITFVLSRNDVIGDGDEIFLFSEPANYSLQPGDTLYRNDSNPGIYSLFVDYFKNSVPTGDYYMALWLDPTNVVQESNEINNASLSWGTVQINNGFGLNAPATKTQAKAVADTGLILEGEAYNGKVLPARQVSVRKVHISATPQGGRRLELATGPGADIGPQVRAEETHSLSKVARSRQQVIFPVESMKPMPQRN